MDLDAGLPAAPSTSSIANDADIDAAFDQITYGKGGPGGRDDRRLCER